MNKPLRISIPGLRRLPRYHALVKELHAQGIQHISSTAMAAHMNMDPIKIRKDLEAVQIIGKPKIGYEARDIVEKIETFMGWNRLDEMILIGCGDLGSALLRYDGFKKRGYKIVAAFDINKQLIGKEINGCQIYAISDINKICSRLKIKIGVLTVPADSAQSLADIMIDCGIKGIWNFSPTALNVPKDIYVQREDLMTSLTILTQQLAEKK